MTKIASMMSRLIQDLDRIELFAVRPFRRTRRQIEDAAVRWRRECWFSRTTENYGDTYYLMIQARRNWARRTSHHRILWLRQPWRGMSHESITKSAATAARADRKPGWDTLRVCELTTRASKECTRAWPMPGRPARGRQPWHSLPAGCESYTCLARRLRMERTSARRLLR